MGKTLSRLAAAVLAAIFAISLAGSASAQDASTPASAAAQPAPAAASTTQVPQEGNGVNWPGVGYGAAALFGNVLYLPAKLVYAIMGGLVGGGAWAVTGGNTQVANTVWRSSLGGDYVLTPQMIAGQQPINFSGPTETAPPPAPGTDTSASSNVQPITPIPAGAPSTAEAAPSSNGSQPMDTGTGQQQKSSEHSIE